MQSRNVGKQTWRDKDICPKICCEFELQVSNPAQEPCILWLSPSQLHTLSWEPWVWSIPSSSSTTADPDVVLIAKMWLWALLGQEERQLGPGSSALGEEPGGASWAAPHLAPALTLHRDVGAHVPSSLPHFLFLILFGRMKRDNESGN